MYDSWNNSFLGISAPNSIKEWANSFSYAIIGEFMLTNGTLTHWVSIKITTNFGVTPVKWSKISFPLFLIKTNKNGSLE